MAKSRQRAALDATLFLQIALVLFLVTLGIVGLLQYNSRLSELGRSLNRFFGRADNPISILVAILELAAGIIIGLAMVIRLERRVIWLACIVIFILWIIWILWVFFFNNAFEPDFAVWLNSLSADLVILSGLWIVTRRYA